MTSGLALCAFAAVTFGVMAIGSVAFDLFIRNQTRMTKRMNEEFRDSTRTKVQMSPLFRDLSKLGMDQHSKGLSPQARLQTAIAQAGLTWTIKYLLALSLLSGSVAGLLALVTSTPWTVVSISVCVGFVVPMICIYYYRRERMARMCRQLPDAFETMSRALRSGQTIPASFQIIANDSPLPIKEEFAHCYEQQHLGISFEVAMRDLARRMGFLEAHIFSVALIVNRQVGGNLANLLSKLAEIMRKRARFHGRLRALTGEGRMQASILIALPILAFLSLSILDPEYAQVLLERPYLIVATAVSQLIGTVLILAIIRNAY